MQRVVCAVREGGGWRVRSCRRDIVGWRLQQEHRVDGSSFEDVLRSIGERGGEKTVLALGLDRAHMVVRLAPMDAAVDDVLPHGVELVTWVRTVGEGRGRRREIVACPREFVDGLFEASRAAGFGATVLFPVWAVADRGFWVMREEIALVWQGGSALARAGRLGPWRDGEPSQGVEVVSGIDASLKGGLSYALTGVPAGWSSGPRRTASRPVVAVLFALALLAWGVGRSSWIERRVAAVEKARRISPEAALPRRECTIEHVARLLVAAVSIPGVTFDRLHFASSRVTVIGTAKDPRTVEALGESLGVVPAAISQGESLTFRAEIVLPCAR